jgi:hypothetical protein
LSPAELQRLAEAEKTEGQMLQKGFGSILQALGAFIDCQDQSTRPALAVAMGKSREFQEMLKAVPREKVEFAIDALISERLPNATAEQREEVREAFTHEVNRNVLTSTAQQLKKSVTAQLTLASDRFEQAAKDPKQLDAMMANLARLEAKPMTAAKQAEASMLREALGVGDGPISRDSLAKALTERAALMRNEAQVVSGGGETTLYQSLKLHSGLAKAMQTEQGVTPGSWASSGAELVMGRADADKNLVTVSKLLSSVALGVSGAGFLTIGAFNLPHVSAKWAEVDRARAGVSGGTADRAAVTGAQREAAIATAEALVAMAMGGKSPLLQETPLHEVGGHALKHAGAELGLFGVAHAAEHAAHPQAQGVDGDGVTRATRGR